MKWAVTILIVLGVLAALSAMVLSKTLLLKKDNLAGASSSDTMVLAARDMKASEIVTLDAVTEDAADKGDLPAGYLSNSKQAVGRILRTPVLAGQILTKSCFVPQGTPEQVISLLSDGMRAVGISLSRSSVSGDLLYPGCIVDVLATFKMGRSMEQAVSTYVLRGIQVLMVGGSSIVSAGNEEEPGKKKKVRASNSSRRGHIMVTLMVDTVQAHALQLAMRYGNVSLAVRNPLDKKPVETMAMKLVKGQLTGQAEKFDPSRLEADRGGHAQGATTGAPFYTDAGHPAEKFDPSRPEVNKGGHTQGSATGAPFYTDAGHPTETVFDPNTVPSNWTVYVIRGQDITRVEVNIPQESEADDLN